MWLVCHCVRSCEEWLYAPCVRLRRSHHVRYLVGTPDGPCMDYGMTHLIMHHGWWWIYRLQYKTSSLHLACPHTPHTNTHIHTVHTHTHTYSTTPSHTCVCTGQQRMALRYAHNIITVYLHMYFCIFTFTDRLFLRKCVEDIKCISFFLGEHCQCKLQVMTTMRASIVASR